MHKRLSIYLLNTNIFIMQTFCHKYTPAFARNDILDSAAGCKIIDAGIVVKQFWSGS